MPIPVPPIDLFVEEEGEQVRHLIGMRCFCHGADGQPDPNCTAHENGGWLYHNERTIVGLVTDISQRRELMETGVFMPGDAVFSPLTQDTVSEGDKIIFTWPLPYGQGDTIVRGTGATDRLYYEAVSSIYCVDEFKNVYKEGRDFVLGLKAILWLSGSTPDDRAAFQPYAYTELSYQTSTRALPMPAGRRYTIKYKAYIEWIAFVPPVERITHGDDLGSKVMLRKKHLMESR